MNKIFFTSDTHFFHTNIIKYCNRNFKSIEDMNEIFIQNWNSVINVNDEIYHLGDFGFGTIEKLLYIFSRLNGKKFLIKGNHCDKSIKLPWEWVKDYHEMTYKDTFFCMMHYPIKIWNHKHHGAICLGGHSHLKVNEFKERYMDVGVDANSYFPVDIDTIVYRMSEITNYKLSHH